GKFLEELDRLRQKIHLNVFREVADQVRGFGNLILRALVERVTPLRVIVEGRMDMKLHILSFLQEIVENRPGVGIAQTETSQCLHEIRTSEAELLQDAHLQRDAIVSAAGAAKYMA